MPGEANATDISLFRRLVEDVPPAGHVGAIVPRAQAQRAMPLALLAVDLIGWVLVFLWQAGEPVAVDRPLVLFLALAITALGRRGLYGEGMAGLNLRSIATALGGALAISLLAVGLLHSATGLTAAFAPLALAALAILGGRAGLALAVRSAGPGWLTPRAVLVGSGQDVSELLAACRGYPEQPRLLGWIGVGEAAGTVPGLPCLGGWHRLVELAQAGMVEQAILAGPARETDTLARRCAALPVAIQLARPRLERAGSCLGTWELAPTLDPPAGFWPRLLKRAEDVLLGSLLLAVVAVPMALVALAIRLDSPGPALFRQRRTGLSGKPFEMFKFRTMRHDPVPTPGCIQAVRGDPRVTRLGAFLRRTSLDELPQLFNVLRGDMSLVGPRPHAPGTSANGQPFEVVVPFYAGRHRVKPGITGLAQVRGLRGETRTEADVLARVEADYEYIATWSLGLDLLILLRTALAVLSMRNAY